jgi:spore coat protein U-like protein
LRFGAYNVFDVAPVDAVGTVLVQCQGLDSGAQVVIGIGRGSDRGFYRRALRYRRYHLDYQIYIDAARTLVWGDGTGGTSVMRARPSDDAPVSIPLFGRIAPRQNVGPGEYDDQIVITVDY